MFDGKELVDPLDGLDRAIFRSASPMKLTPLRAPDRLRQSL
jgi:hypothetical protein